MGATRRLREAPPIVDIENGNLVGSTCAANPQARRIHFEASQSTFIGSSMESLRRTKHFSMETLGIALSGMQSAQTRVAVSAHNVANLLTEDFRPQRVAQSQSPSGGSQTRVLQSRSPEPVSLEREIVDQIQAKTAYTASARVFAVGAEIQGTLLDILA